MKGYLRRIKERFFNIQNNGMQLVLFNVMLWIAIVSGAISCVLSFFSTMPLKQTTSMALAIVLSLFAFYEANYKGNFDLAVDILVVSVGYIAFPIMFFTCGGVYCGMSSWVAIGIICIVLLSEGMHCAILLGIDFVIIISCYVL